MGVAATYFLKSKRGSVSFESFDLLMERLWSKNELKWLRS